MRLSATPSQQVINHAEAGRAALHDALEGMVAIARTRWTQAAAESARHVALVVANNPGKTVDDILGRPDIQQALRDNWQTAVDDTRRTILRAWSMGVRLGSQQAEQDMATLGMQPGSPPAPLEVGRELLKRFLDDAETNAEAAGDRMIAAVRSSDGSSEGVRNAVTTEASKQATRARAGITMAGGEGYHAAQTTMYAEAAAAGGYVVKVMWVTHFRPGTCRTCAALHGDVVVLGTEFDHFAHLGAGKPPTVFGSLAGPPRHPNCGCRLVPFIDAEVVQQAKDSPTVETPPVRTDTAGPTPASLKRYRDSWFGALLRTIKSLLGFRRTR